MLLQGFVIFICFTIAGGQINKSKHPSKGFYCKDPDTGKLYPVNTTWMSSSFCGSYTCRIKKKDHSDKSLTRDVTASDRNQPPEIDYMNKVETRKHDNIILQGDKAMELQSILHAMQNKSTGLETRTIPDKTGETGTANVEKDRLLSEDEIGSMTTLLKSMKVSELDAVLQVLHLAHDLYSDIDKMVIHDEINEVPDTTLNTKATYKNRNIVSYWYEPLTITNNRVKADPTSFLKKTNENMVTQKANFNSKDTPLGNNKYNFKIRPLLHEDSDMLNKLLKFTSSEPKSIVYYDPMSEFQRHPSHTHNPLTPYRHPKPASVVPVLPTLFQNPTVPKPNFALQDSPYPEKCWKKIEAPIDKKLHLLPWLSSKIDLANNKLKLDDLTAIPQASVQLPLQYLGEITEDISPLSLLTLSNKAYPRSLNSPYVSQSSNSINEDQSFDNMQRPKESSPLLSHVGISEGHLSPGWSSGSAGVPVFNDIKSPEEAIASGNLLPFPFRKNSNIKKMPYTGEKRRKKRDEVPSGGNSEEFEVYLEKSTCQTDIEPGFFRMGDSSQPFPECCPKRIGNDQPEESLRT